MKDPTLRGGEKVVTKATPTIRVIVRNPTLYVRSQCMNLYPLPTTSYDPHLLNIQPLKHPLNILCCMSVTPKTKIGIALFLLRLATISTIDYK
jgi:hypothetical protein